MAEAPHQHTMHWFALWLLFIIISVWLFVLLFLSQLSTMTAPDKNNSASISLIDNFPSLDIRMIHTSATSNNRTFDYIICCQLLVGKIMGLY